MKELKCEKCGSPLLTFPSIKKVDISEWIKWAESEIKEYKKFIKSLNKK
jgi:hypothetical protein